MPLRTEIPSRAAALALALLFALSPLAHADSQDTAASLGETVRILESGRVGNVSDFCPHLRRELDRAKEQLDAERRDLRRAIENPPSANDRVTRGWARSVARRQRQLQATGRSIAELERRIDRLCPPAAARAAGRRIGALASGAAGAAAAGSAAGIVVTPVAFAGGRLSGQVIDESGQPLTGAAVTFGDSSRPSSDRLSGLVMTDAEGRFEIDVPDQGDEVSLAVLGTGIAAASRLLAAGQPSPVGAPSPTSLVQAGATLDLPERVHVPWIEQGGRALSALSSLAVSRNGDRAMTTVRCPDGLLPGEATLGWKDDSGSERTMPLRVYRVEDSYLEEDLLRAGQSAGFGWAFDLGAGAAGTTAEVCARVSGPVTLIGERCQTATADPQGRLRYASSIRAHSVTGEAVFSLEPDVEIQDRDGDDPAADDGDQEEEVDERRSAQDRSARELEAEAGELRAEAERLEREADRRQGTDPEGAAQKRIEAGAKHAEAEKKYREAERKYAGAGKSYDRNGDAKRAAEAERQAEAAGREADAARDSNRAQRTRAAQDYRGKARRSPEGSARNKASESAAELERDLALEAEKLAGEAAKEGDFDGAAAEMRRAAGHYDRAAGDFEDAHHSSKVDGMKDRSRTANDRAEQYERRAERDD